jgi:hypothetical protein
MMVARGHGLCVCFGVFGETTKNKRHLPACISGFFSGKKIIKCSLPATNHQNTSRVNSFRLPSNEMTLMRMVVMVAIRPIWLLWSAKL